MEKRVLSRKKRRLNIGMLVLFILIPIVAGFIGGVATSSSVSTWYAQLNKPSFNPPSWIFSPVWTLLYILMGIASFFVWNAGKGTSKKNALVLFYAQLLLNVLWSFLFFGLKNPLLALIDIVLLWFFILITMTAFFRISKTAGWLLLPYILWVSFASVLNLAIVLLN